MEKRMHDLVEQSIGAWGAHDQLSIVQEACAETIAAIAWVRRSHAGVEQLAHETARLMMAVESLIQIVGREAVEQKLAANFPDIEVDLEMHKVNPIPLNGVA